MQAATYFAPWFRQAAGTALVFALLVVFVSPSNGDVMTYDVDFTANSLVVGSGPDPAPVDPVIGSFQITFDPTLTYVNQTSGISLTSLNIALGSPLSFSFDPVSDGFGGGTLVVGGAAGGSGIVTFSPSTDDFWLFITDFVSTPAFEQLGYSQTSVSNNNLFFTLNQTGSVNVSAAIPEPSSMLLVGMIGGAFCLVRRKRAIAS